MADFPQKNQQAVAAGRQAGAAGGQKPPLPPQEPSTGGFRIQARRTVPVNELSKHFAELSFLQLSVEKDALIALSVESRDLKKDPALFSVAYFRPASIEVLYTCLPAMSPKKRRLDVLRHFLNLLTLSEDCYDVSVRQLYQLLEKSASDMNEYVTADYDRLFALYDNMKTEIGALQKKSAELSAANSNLSKENYELKNRNDELVLKIKSLETLSDSVLALKIQDWLSEHKGEINVSDFSKVYNVPESRVEQMLNKMVTEGYLETKG